jgi:hypothetical protein
MMMGFSSKTEVKKIEKNEGKMRYEREMKNDITFLVIS